MLTDSVKTKINEAVAEYVKDLSERIDNEKEISRIITAVATKEIPSKLAQTIKVNLSQSYDAAEQEVFAEFYAKQKRVYACPKGTDLEEITRKRAKLKTTIDSTKEYIKREKILIEDNQAQFDEVIDLNYYSPNADLRSYYCGEASRRIAQLESFPKVDTKYLIKLIRSDYFGNRDFRTVIFLKVLRLEDIKKAQGMLAGLEHSLAIYNTQLSAYDRMLEVGKMPKDPLTEGAKLVAPFDEKFKAQQQKLRLSFTYDSFEEFIFSSFAHHLKPYIAGKRVFQETLVRMAFIDEFADYKLRILNILNGKKIKLSGDKLNRLENLIQDINDYPVTIDSTTSQLAAIILKWQGEVVSGKTNEAAFSSSGCRSIFSKTPEDQFIQDCLDIVEEVRVANPIYASN
ncbi:MAG: hypothetical protein EPN84_00475 [Legionella sp.]|nr:MAG: hypothetical protein EPN84_00475 [Legionella sp.]